MAVNTELAVLEQDLRAILVGYHIPREIAQCFAGKFMQLIRDEGSGLVIRRGIYGVEERKSDRKRRDNG